MREFGIWFCCLYSRPPPCYIVGPDIPQHFWNVDFSQETNQIAGKECIYLHFVHARIRENPEHAMFKVLPSVDSTEKNLIKLVMQS